MKFSMYNFPIEVEDGIILYNSKCCRFINIFNQEDKNHYNELLKSGALSEEDDMVQQLYKAGFIVDDDCDEYNQVKESINKTYKESEQKLSLFIYVTEKCNFRCIYCPQKHEPKVLSVENWANLYNYIEKNIKSGRYKLLNFYFFGGEPLLEKNAIVSFLRKINKLLEVYTDVYSYHSITTNGYLLSPDTYDELMSLGVQHFQITVDGFAETHDKMRPRADGEGTWNIITENLKYINSVNDDAYVILRSNCNAENYDSIKAFFEWANKTFDNKKIVFDIEPVTKFSEQVQDSLVSKHNTNELIDLLQSLDRYADAADPRKKLFPLAKVCKYVEQNFFVITVDGKIGKCETAYDKDNLFVGYLNNNDFVLNEQYNNWVSDFEIEDCKTCLIYPICGARVCPYRKIQDPIGRTDCFIRHEDVKEKIRKLFTNGYMDKVIKAQRQAK